MLFFEGLRFLGWKSLPKYADWNDREFMSYYSLNFNFSGALKYAFTKSRDEKPVYRLINAPCVWINAPSKRYLYGAPQGQTRWHRWVSFTGSRVERYFNEGLLKNNVTEEPILINQPDKLGNELDVLFDLLEKHQHEEAVNCLECIFLMIQKQPRELVDQTLTARIQSLIRSILLNPGKQWEFSEQAARMSITDQHFRRVFKECIQTSPGQFLQKARLEYAAELLRSTPYTLSEISYQSGFTDPNYFSRLFSRRYEISPSQYRKISAETPPTNDVENTI